MPRFADHFSSAARAYSRYRPNYPEELFDYLAAEAPAPELAWDCATGSGQAAGPLGARFRRVIATDASIAQLARREPFPRVHYAAAPAEAAPLADGSVDLLAVSQALHWFAHERFFAEAERVLAPGGVLAVWTYDLLRIDPAIDALVDRYHDEVVAPYWAPERVHVDSRYANLDFPFERLEPPAFRMTARWTLDRLVGYLSSWSAVRRYRAARGEDPVPRFERELSEVWPEPAAKREVSWTLTVLVGRTSGT